MRSLMFLLLFVPVQVFAQTDSSPKTTDEILPKLVSADDGEVEVSAKTDTGAAPVAAFATDITDESLLRKRSVQIVVITNLSDTAICVKTTTHQGDCSLLAMTCNAAGANNGQPVLAGTQRSFKFTPKRKICILAEGGAATKSFIAERIVRR